MRVVHTGRSSKVPSAMCTRAHVRPPGVGFCARVALFLYGVIRLLVRALARAHSRRQRSNTGRGMGNFKTFGAWPFAGSCVLVRTVPGNCWGRFRPSCARVPQYTTRHSPALLRQRVCFHHRGGERGLNGALPVCIRRAFF